MSPSTHRRPGLPRRRTAGLAVAAALAVSGLVAAPQVAAAAPDPGSPVKVNQVAYVPGVAKVATLVSTSTSPVAVDAAERGRHGRRVGPVDGQGLRRAVRRLDAPHRLLDVRHPGHRLRAVRRERQQLPVRHLRRPGEEAALRLAGVLLPPAQRHRDRGPVRRQHLRARRPATWASRRTRATTSVPVPAVAAATAWTCAAAGTTRATRASTSSTAASPRGSCRTPTSGPSTSRAPTRRRWATARMAIPERANGAPDILDEARWEVEFLLRMQVPAGRTERRDGAPQDPRRELDRPADAARAGQPAPAPVAGEHRGDAQPGRGGGAGVAAVEDARPDVLGQGPRRGADRVHAPPRRTRTGSRPRATAPAAARTATTRVTDEFYWAAAELYATTGSARLPRRRHRLVAATRAPASHSAATTGAGPAALGDTTLALVPNGLPSSDVAATRAAIVTFADAALTRATSQAYPAPNNAGSVYYWGSNGQVANNANALALALRLHRPGEVPHRRLRRARLLPGPQPAQPVLHRRLRREGGPERAPPVLGAPGERVPADRAARLVLRRPEQRAAGPDRRGAGSPAAQPQKCFVDHIEAYSVNEVAINWNSALAWLASWAAEHAGSTPTVDTTPPSTPGTPTASAVGRHVRDADLVAVHGRGERDRAVRRRARRRGRARRSWRRRPRRPPPSRA